MALGHTLNIECSPHTSDISFLGSEMLLSLAWIENHSISACHGCAFTSISALNQFLSSWTPKLPLFICVESLLWGRTTRISSTSRTVVKNLHSEATSLLVNTLQISTRFESYVISKVSTMKHPPFNIKGRKVLP